MSPFTNRVPDTDRDHLYAEGVKAQADNLGWDGLRIGEKVSQGPRRTPMLRIDQLSYPMHEADVECPVCKSRALDGRECGAKTLCMEEGCGTLYNWHDFANRCEAHDGP